MREVCSIELHFSCSGSWPIIGLQEDLFFTGVRLPFVTTFSFFLTSWKSFGFSSIYLLGVFPVFHPRQGSHTLWGRQLNYHCRAISETLQIKRSVLSRHTCAHSETGSSVCKLETVKSSFLHAWTWIFPFDSSENEGRRGLAGYPIGV